MTLLELFRLLTSFTPKRQSLAKGPWEEYVEWSVGQGLAPLSAYNLEYRFAGAGAPDWARDRLLGIYQGLLNDNVMKLVNFKRSVDALEGRRVVMLGSATFAEHLYPHVAFRPVSELRLFMAAADVQPLAGFLKGAEFNPAPATEDDALAPDLVLSDSRTALLLHGRLGTPEDEALLQRAVHAKVYGPSIYRLPFDDALLVQVLFAAKAGFDIPFIEWVDLRELAMQPLDAKAVLERAHRWKIERGLYAAMKVVSRLFPETDTSKLTPELSAPIAKLLDISVVDPVAVVGKSSTTRPAEALRALLASSG